jgi:hypothetical protein
LGASIFTHQSINSNVVSGLLFDLSNSGITRGFIWFNSTARHGPHPKVAPFVKKNLTRIDDDGGCTGNRWL